MPDRHSFLKWLSQRFNASALTHINAIQHSIQQSRLTRILQITPGSNATLSSANPCEYMTVERLACSVQSASFVRHDPTLAQASTYTETKLRLSLFACLYWRETPSIQIRYPLPLRTKAYHLWWLENGPPLLRKADETIKQSADTPYGKLRFCDKEFGVNLIGHAFNIFGLGEYLRMIARALDAADIPYCVLNVPVGNGSADHDRTLESKILPVDQPTPFAFNLFCMTAETHIHQVIWHSWALNGNTYSIATWFWEMEYWPDALINALDLADEYWPCSQFIEKALTRARIKRKEMGIGSDNLQPIHLMPPVVDLSKRQTLHVPASHRRQTRQTYALDPDAVLFSFIFDLNSTIARKNPQAVLNAFHEAFGPATDAPSNVGLLIKTFPPRQPSPLWESLKESASVDSRIKIIEADLDRSSLFSLLACCDAFVSLHRSEGLGMGLAEALQLGLDVIATNYGGNNDFFSGPLAHPIPYTLLPVQQGEYPYHQGMHWAEPDLESAAKVMREVAHKRNQHIPVPGDVIEAYRHQFSAERVGAHYRRRLEFLWQSRDKIQSELSSIAITARP